MELFDILTRDGGHIEYLWHVGGMPYAFATSQVLIDAINTEKIGDITRVVELFGASQVGLLKLATTVKFCIGLQTPGSQSFRIHDATGMLSGGNWSVELAREDLGMTWTHRIGTIWGAEGIQVLPDVRVDNTICQTYVSRNFLKGDTSLFVLADPDTGGRLYARIAALGLDEYQLLWIGKECVAATDIAPAGMGGAEYEITVKRGVLRSRDQSYYLENHFVSALPVADAPLGGIAERGSYLWAQAMDGSTLVGDPVLIRHGAVSQAIKSQGGLTAIDCLPWQESLKTAFNLDPLESTLKGYTLMHPPATEQRLEGHIIIEGEGVWLCPVDAVVYFPDWPSLRKAINAEFVACRNAGSGFITANGSSGFDVLYKLDSSDKLRNTDENGQPGCDTIWGPVTLLCNLGAIKKTDKAQFIEQVKNCDMRFASNPSGYTQSGIDVMMTTLSADGELLTDATTGKTLVGILPDTYRALYLVQYYYTAGNDWNYLGPSIKTFPVPPNPDTGTSDLQLPNDGSIDDFPVAGFITVGREDYGIEIPDGKDSSWKRTTLLKGYATKSGTALTLESSTGSGFDAETRNFGEHLAALRTVDARDIQPLQPGYLLCYIPAIHVIEDTPVDPWPVRVYTDIASRDIVDVFMALLGGGTGIQLSDRYQMSHVPDAYDSDPSVTRSDFEATIDWEQIRTLTREAMGGAELSVAYKLNPKEGGNFLDIFTDEMVLHGLMPTWEYRADVRQWVIGVREIGAISATQAWLEGRTLGPDELQTGVLPREVHTGTWLYNRIEIECNYDAAQKKYLGKFLITSPAGYALKAGKEKTLKLRARLTQIAGLADNPDVQQKAAEYFAELLQPLIWPQAEVSIKTSCARMLSIGLGREILITDSTIKNPYTGQQGITNMVGLVLAKKDDLRTGACELTVRLAAHNALGWAPAIRVTASTAGADTVACTAVDKNAFSDVSWGRSDLSYFDCVVHNPSVHAAYTYVARGCSCDRYKVIAYEEGSDCTDIQRLEFEIDSFDFAAGANSGTCTLHGADAVLWDESKTYIVVFGAWDDAALQPCQRYFVFSANELGELTDSAAAQIDGMKWN